MISNQSSFHSMKERDVRQSYVRFQSERHQTSQNIGDSHDSLQLKGLTREFHIKYPIQSLLTHFKQIFNDKGFKTTEVFPGKIMLVKLGVMDRIKFILSSKQPKRYLLVIKTQQYKSVRKVTIKRLREHPNIQYEHDEQQIKQLFNWIDQNPAKLPETRKDHSPDDEFEVFNQYQQDMYSLQATSTYMYHKIFVDRNYSMGRKMSKLVADSKDQLHQHTNKETIVIIGGLKQITEDMLKSFNCTRKQLLQILCHCRKTVEDYYHDRKFVLKSKQQLEFQRGSIETQIAEKVPQTVKAFYKLLGESNSQKILRQIFLIHYVFEIECELGKISEPQKNSLAKKLGSAFYKQLILKTKTLDLWGYQDAYYTQYLQDFIN